jgi:protocatechuate 3,4-dioxygenase beta subunit
MSTPQQQTPATSISRRQMLGGLGALTAVTIIGCNSDGSSSDSTTTTSTTTSSTSSTSTTNTTSIDGNCAIIPTETQGPFPLLAFLSNAAVRRQDITEGKTGVPLTVKLKLVNVNDSCKAIANTAVYIWHCDKDGSYSGYTSAQNGDHVSETFLRGVQVTDSNGEVTFSTIYPGWYPGRITHIHFQAYLSDNLNITATATSQLAFPQAITSAVNSSSLYHGQNTSVASFAADNIFSDGTTYQMATVTGDVNTGYVASLTVGIAVVGVTT